MIKKDEWGNIPLPIDVLTPEFEKLFRNKSNSLIFIPELLSEWHPTKNGDLKPEHFAQLSGKIAWWLCPKGEDHEWQTTIASRSLGTGCPCCAGKKASKTNNLLVMNPELASEWHSTKNGDLKPENFASGSTERVWWKCSKDGNHEWKNTIGNRFHSGNGCPDCANNEKLKKKSQIFIMKYTKTPYGVYRSIKSAIEDHNSKNSVIRMTKGKIKEWSNDSNITEYQFITEDDYNALKGEEINNLKVLFPEIAKEWHPTKNTGNPANVKVSSYKTVWWKCSKGDDHEWQAGISSRCKGSGCPFCSGRVPDKTNNLKVLFPEIAKEWHPTKNGDKKPEQYKKSSSSKKVWWLCSEGHEAHEKVSVRVRFKGCRICSGNKFINGRLNEF